MKGSLYSDDGAYAFPLGPKVTTIGRENCDISINSPQVDNQHALLEYDDEQRCFILKDLNSSTGTYVHDCRVQNAAVRLVNGDIIRFGFNGLPLTFRTEQPAETTMPSIYQKQAASNGLQLISQTIPSRRGTNGATSQPQQIDIAQNPGFSLRTRPASVGAKRPPNGLTTGQDPPVRTNAWTTSARSTTNGTFIGELDISLHDNVDITNRVEQLEREVKGRDADIRGLNDRLRSLEPSASSHTNEVRALRTELEKVKREKQATAGLITGLQRDLHLKESDLAKATRELEAMKNDSRDKDLRLQSVQAKLNLIRDRDRAEEDRSTKEKELKIKLAEQQISELTASVNRLKSQLQDTETQLSRLNQNEQKLKQEGDDARQRLAEVQQSEAKLTADLKASQKQHSDFCARVWQCFAIDADDDYDEEQHNIVERIQQLKQQLAQSQTRWEEQRDTHASSNEQLRAVLTRLIDILSNALHEQATTESIAHVRQQMDEVQEGAEEGTLAGMFKRAAMNVMEQHARVLAELNSLVVKRDDQPGVLPAKDAVALVRRQFEELERERQGFATERTSQEDAIRSECERTIAEKDAAWQQRYNDECDRLRQETAQMQSDLEEQIRTLNDRLASIRSENDEHLQEKTTFQAESTRKVDELTEKLAEYQRLLREQRDQQTGLTDTHEKQKEELARLEKEKSAAIEDLTAQVDVYKGQVRLFSKTIVQLEKTVAEEQERRVKMQAELDSLNKKVKGKPPTPPAAVSKTVPVVSVVPIPVVDTSNELHACHTRIQEQEQIIVSLRRDLAGMNARLSDVHGELTDKQKRALEKSDTTIRDQTKELNATRLKLSKLSDIVDKQAAKIESLQSELSKSKVLADQYQLLVDQRQADIERLNRTLDQKTSIVERTERVNQDEGRVTHELVAIGAQCKGERHELTIGRQREALSELRARIKSLEQLRPANPSYEKTLQQVVSLKRELAEMRARQALPTDIPYLTPTMGLDTNAARPPLPIGDTSCLPPEAQKVIEERMAHAETMNILQSCDELYHSFARNVVRLLGVEDETFLNTSSLAATPGNDRQRALQQRHYMIDVLQQRIEVLHDRLVRKEDLLKDYEKDLGKLRQAEILLRDKDMRLQDLETDKQIKDDETLFLRNTLKDTQGSLNQEKRTNAALKHSRHAPVTQSNELVRRSGGSAINLHHHCPPDDTTGKVQTIQRDMNQKLSRKNYEIKTLKQELHEALDTLSEQSNKVKLLELQSMEMANNVVT